MYGNHMILIDLAMGLVVAELKAQVPESVLLEIMPRLKDMMTLTTKSKKQVEQSRRAR